MNRRETFDARMNLRFVSLRLIKLWRSRSFEHEAVKIFTISCFPVTFSALFGVFGGVRRLFSEGFGLRLSFVATKSELLAKANVP